MEQTSSVQLDIPDFSNSVLSHLNQLRIQGRLCDIVVNVQGQSFRAHKVVLAASSPYFRDHMSLGEMSTVSISVIRNPCVFEQLLSFCYTGRLRLRLADIISYLTAASFLQMQHIIDRCTQILEGVHFTLSLADVEKGLGVRGQVHGGEARAPGSGRRGEVRAGTQPLSPGQNTPQAGDAWSCRDAISDIQEQTEVCEVSPPGESMSPQVIEHSEPGTGGHGGSEEPFLRINQSGQWYVEAGPEADGGAVRIKTESLEDWTGAEAPLTGSEGGAEEGAPKRTGHRVWVQEGFNAQPSGSRNSHQPTSSLRETERFSPTGSVAEKAERHRAKAESPGRGDDQSHPTSQGEEQAAYDGGGYEEYLREQVGDPWFRYNPRLTCIYCCKSFNQKGSLDRHMRLHMGITPFACRICGKKYTRKDQLEYHIRKHTGNKPFHCHVCGKSFPFQAILNQHLRKNHPARGPHSASPETTTQAGPRGDDSPGREEPEGSGGGGGASVSTTGPD
ncbi:zinc finger and BTB domain-containing protein 37 [Paramormyrops kingsleyae]|uniref:Zinc finger and BTB domain containing 37 n=1 Tax=Paramormyrops kingsleyae TaxID=1676925 RepID=A0A3B3RBE7_9TELE|nr:zinc finger and BTB domain-containing protein 37-like [Paramormyrops kingsleyae]XP_023668942.1 zinc finger and BTB domain-containing protein 37-like [Paramormyrops kingsleyae]